MTGWLRSVVLPLIALGLVSCSEPGDVANDGGVRAVVLSPSAAATLQSLGLESVIVGRHEWDMVLPKRIPVCGSQAELDHEAILSVDPTHLVIEWGQRDLPESLVSLADANEIRIVNLGSVLTLTDIDAATDRLLDELAPGRRSDQRVGVYGGPGTSYTGRVLLLSQVDPPGALGPGSYNQQILEQLGAVPALTVGGAWQALDGEDLLRIDPDAVIVVSPTQDGGTSPDSAGLERLRSFGLRAAAEGRVAFSRHPLGLLPSVRLTEWRDELREILDGLDG